MHAANCPPPPCGASLLLAASLCSKRPLRRPLAGACWLMLWVLRCEPSYDLFCCLQLAATPLFRGRGVHSGQPVLRCSPHAQQRHQHPV